MADSSIFDGNRWPHWGQFCGLSTPTTVDLRGGLPDRLEPACGSNSSSRSINLCGTLARFYPSVSLVTGKVLSRRSTCPVAGLIGSGAVSLYTRFSFRCLHADFPFRATGSLLACIDFMSAADDAPSSDSP